MNLSAVEAINRVNESVTVEMLVQKTKRCSIRLALALLPGTDRCRTHVESRCEHGLRELHLATDLLDLIGAVLVTSRRWRTIRSISTRSWGFNPTCSTSQREVPERPRPLSPPSRTALGDQPRSALPEASSGSSERASDSPWSSERVFLRPLPEEEIEWTRQPA